MMIRLSAAPRTLFLFLTPAPGVSLRSTPQALCRRPLRGLLLHLDADRARRDRALLRHAFGARTVVPAMAPAPLVQQQSNNSNMAPNMKDPSHGAGGI
jgi:hypothetical protein